MNFIQIDMGTSNKWKIGLLFLFVLFSGCTLTFAQNIPDKALMDSVQYQTFRYFWDFAEPNSGLARERFHPDGKYPQNDAHVVTTGGSGFGLMAILVGIERGYISRKQGVERLQKITTFLEKADRFHGAWPHWINGNTGKVVPFGKKDNGGDLVETSFLVEGLLCVRQYFSKGNVAERQLSQRIDALWRGIEWNWFTQGKDVLYWHWSPNFGWEMNFALQGYNECLITYILGAASPQYAIKPEAYHKGWARDGKIVSSNVKYGLPLILSHNAAEEYGGPLFWAHYSFVGLDPRKLKDKYADYWQLNTNHSKINYQYCVENPLKMAGYGKDCWGITASYSRMPNGDIGYISHKPFLKDIGVISPTAALSSMPYTPKESLQAMRYFYQNKSWLWGPAGFYDAFSIQHNNWVAPRYLAIDQGPIVAMIENHRTGLLWKLFMSCPEVKIGLKKLGFQ